MKTNKIKLKTKQKKELVISSCSLLEANYYDLLHSNDEDWQLKT